MLLGNERPARGDYREILYGKRGGSYLSRLVVYADLVHTDPWFLMVSAGLADWSWGMVVTGYAKRFTCEESYRDEEELAQDVLEIITVFSARLYGSRSRKNQKLLEGVKQAVEEVASS